MRASSARILASPSQDSIGTKGKSLKARIAAALLCVLLVVLGVVIYVGVTVGKDLKAARSSIGSNLSSVTTSDLVEGRGHLRDAMNRLRGPLARAVGLLPVVSTNLDSVEDTTEATIGVTSAAIQLQERLEGLNLMSKGGIDLGQLEKLRPELDAQAEAFADLGSSSERALNGLLLPPLYDEISDAGARATELNATLTNLEDLIGVAPELLGSTEPRTYVVLLVNNAELRGSGGVITGIGSLSFDDGRVTIGKFSSIHDFTGRPYFEVEAPAEYVRRFANYKANTSMLLNTTFSADFPDVAGVAARVHEELTDIEVHGVLQADPRGLASLMGEDSEIDVDGAGLLDPDEVAEFALSGAYDVFKSQSTRREALLEIGESIFASALSEGAGDREMLSTIGKAAAGGHLKFVSFDNNVAPALAQTGITWDLADPHGDDVLVTAQNFGGGPSVGSKLDYWVDREIDHDCAIGTDGAASCTTAVRLTNKTPAGLSRYVAGRPYGLLRNYVEIFIPGQGDLLGVTKDGRPVESRSEHQAGRTSVGIYVELPRGQQSQLSVDYSLPPAPGYSVVITPQPLSRDAELDLSLELPSGWVLTEGDAETSGRDVSLQTVLDRRLTLRARPDDRPGVSGSWARLVRMWKEPVL